jgi:hypothetical protein
MAPRRSTSESNASAGRRKQILIVDGHSMIFAIPELRQLHEQNTASAREALLVYDGRGARSASEKDPGGVQVFYSDTNHTADDLVERLVAKYAEIYDITVATQDNLERQTVISLGAFCIGAEQLLDRMDSGRQNVQREIAKRNSRNRRWNSPGSHWPGR